MPRVSVRLVPFLVCALWIGVAPVDAAPQPATSAPTTRQVRRRVVVTAPVLSRPANPIPGHVAQQEAERKIREIYAVDYADAAFAGRRTLARRLIDAASQTTRDTDARYVLLREARDVSAEAGDVTTAFEAIDRLVETYPITKLHERVDALGKSVPKLSTTQAQLAGASICMDLVEQCLVEGDYDRVETLLALATSATRAAKSVPYARWIEWRAQSIRPLKAAYEVARPAERILARTPDDPQANATMGRFVAFVKGDFDAGLNLLAKGDDAALAKLADQDLETPEGKAAAQLVMAGAWWDAADAQPEYRNAIRARAGYWYGLAVPGLEGLDKALAQRRLLEVETTAKAAIVKPPRPPDALKLTQRSWYRASVAELTWETAQRICADSGGKLVSIETRAEGDLIIKLARGRSLWIGAVSDGAGRWSWLSGGSVFYSNWASGEPSKLTTDAHPLIAANGAWRTSTGKAGFICEFTE